MNIESVPFNLYKTNIALQLRITQLMQECRQRWLESAQQRNADAIAQTETEMKDLLQSARWQSLGILRPETFGLLFQATMSGTRTISQTVIENQVELAAGVQQALQDWQKAMAAIFGGAHSRPSLQNLARPESPSPAAPERTAKGA